jgi:hypothetical protein
VAEEEEDLITVHLEDLVHLPETSSVGVIPDLPHVAEAHLEGTTIVPLHDEIEISMSPGDVVIDLMVEDIVVHPGDLLHTPVYLHVLHLEDDGETLPLLLQLEDVERMVKQGGVRVHQYVVTAIDPKALAHHQYHAHELLEEADTAHLLHYRRAKTLAHLMIDVEDTPPLSHAPAPALQVWLVTVIAADLQDPPPSPHLLTREPTGKTHGLILG